MAKVASGAGGCSAELPPDALGIVGRELEEAGLSSYEARVLVALLCIGTGGTLQLTQLTGVPRSSIYGTLERLAERGLAERLPVEGAATWASPGRDEVFRRLDRHHEEHLREQRARTARLQEMVAEILPETPPAALPYVHFLRGGPRVKRAYDDLLSNAQAEVVVFNRPPYSTVITAPDPVIVATARRGVHMRALYQRKQWDDADASAFRDRVAAYHAAGVQGRVVEELPMKLAVADRKVALVGMDGPGGPQNALPTQLLIEDPGFAGAQAASFEHYWAQATRI